MIFDTLLFHEASTHIAITIDRLEHQNSINFQLLQELHAVLNYAEKSPECRTLILQGQKGIFCTGLDFHELVAWHFDRDKIKNWAELYMSLLKRLSTTSSVAVIAKLNGKVLAGGTGLAAASDFVIATPAASIKLTEALWGLLPAMVAPYLIKRIGPQKARELALTCRTLQADEACRIGYIDEIAESADEAVQKAIDRFQRLEKKSIAQLKAYFHNMWIIDAKTEQDAVETIVRLLQDPATQGKIKNFVQQGTLPWTT